MEKITQVPVVVEKSITPNDENFLVSFRKNYDRIKTKPEFTNYGLKYCEIMKLGKYPNDVYVDNILMRVELSKLREKYKEFEKKDKTYKNVIAEIYTGVKSHLQTFYEESKKDHKEQIYAIMDTFKVTSSTILKTNTDITIDYLKKQFNLYEQEFKLILRNDWMNKRFDTNRKLFTANMTKTIRNNIAVKDVNEINDIALQKGSALSSVNSSLNSSNQNDQSKVFNLSQNSSVNLQATGDAEVFKKPVVPVTKGRRSSIVNPQKKNENIQNISNPIINLNGKKETVDEKHETPKKINENEKNNVVPSENTFNKNVLHSSTKVMPTVTLPSDDSFSNDIVVESSKIVFLPPSEKNAIVKKNPDKVPSLDTFKNNINIVSTKIAKQAAEKPAEVVADDINPKDSEIKKIPSKNTSESAKADNTPQNKSNSSPKPEEVTDKLEELPSETLFRRNLLHSSTKVKPSSENEGSLSKSDESDGKKDAVKSMKASENNSSPVDAKLEKDLNNLTENLKGLKMKSPYVKRNSRMSVATLDLSTIEERSESSKSENSDTRILKTSFENSKTSCTMIENSENERRSTLSPKNDCSREGARSSGIPTLSGSKKMTSSNEKNVISESIEDDEKENVDRSMVKMNEDSVRLAKYTLDGDLQEFKKTFPLSYSKKSQILASIDIDIPSEDYPSISFDHVYKDPWNKSSRAKIWSEYLPRLLSNQRVKKINFDVDSVVTFDTNLGDQEFVMKTKIHSKDCYDIWIGRCQSNEKDYIIKVQNSSESLDYYNFKYVQSSLTKLSAEKTQAWNINIMPSIYPIFSLTLSDTKSYALIPYYTKGSLVELCNILYGSGFSVKEIELLTSYIAMELITVTYLLHTHVKLLHCNLKPNNIMVNEFFPIFTQQTVSQFKATKVITLSSLKKALCLNRYQPNCKFMTNDEDVSQQCIETKLKMPWSYEIDLFNVATCLYFLLQNSYPRVIQLNERRIFSTINNFSILRAGNVWLNLFNSLLNFETSLYEDLMVYVKTFQQLITDNTEEYNRSAEKVNELLRKNC